MVILPLGTAVLILSVAVLLIRFELFRRLFHRSFESAPVSLCQRLRLRNSSFPVSDIGLISEPSSQARNRRGQPFGSIRLQNSLVNQMIQEVYGIRPFW